MKAALFDGTPGVSLIEAEQPGAGEHDALVRVRYAGVCGSDLYIVSGKNPRTPPPLIPGHEFIGTVEKLPVDYSGPLSEGNRVTAYIAFSCGECEECLSGRERLCSNLRILGCQTNGAFAEQVSIPVRNLFPIPAQLPDRAAALTEPTSIAVHAVTRAMPLEGARTVVVGAGPIGHLVATAARHFGASPVVLLDISPFRLEAARKAGFPVLDATSADLEKEIADAIGGRVDVMFECAAQNSSAELFLHLGAPESHMVIVANYKQETPVHFFKLARNEQRISTSWLATREDYQTALDLLEQGVVKPDLVASHVYPLEQISDAFERARNASDAMRVLVEVGEA